MLRFLLAVVLIALLSGLLTAFLPWWAMAATAFLVAFFLLRSPGKAFLAGFIAIAMLWATLLLPASLRNDAILSTRMAKLFGLPGSGIFLAVNILVGALIGGLAGWSGGLVRKAFVR